MRKCYILLGWTPDNGTYVSGIYSSMRKAEFYKKILEDARTEMDEHRIYRIQTEVII